MVNYEELEYRITHIVWAWDEIMYHPKEHFIPPSEDQIKDRFMNDEVFHTAVKSLSKFLADQIAIEINKELLK